MKAFKKIIGILVMVVILMVRFTAFAGDVPEGLLSEDGAKVFFAEIVSYNHLGNGDIQVIPHKTIKGDVNEFEVMSFKQTSIVGNFIPMNKNVYLFAYFDENNPVYIFNATSYDTKTLKLEGAEGDMWKRMEAYLNEGKFEEADAVRRDALNADIELTDKTMTLTEFLGIDDVDDIKKIYICCTEESKEKVDINEFLAVADEIVLSKTASGAQAARTGIYVDVHRKVGQRTYAYISEKGEVDNYYHIYSRLPARQYITSTANIKKLQDLVSADQGMPPMRSNTEYIYGAVIAGVVILLVVTVIIVRKKKKKKSQNELKETPEEEIAEETKTEE